MAYTPDSFAGDYGWYNPQQKRTENWTDQRVMDFFKSDPDAFKPAVSSYMQGSGKTNQDLANMINYYAPDSGYTAENLAGYTGIANPKGGGAAGAGNLDYGNIQNPYSKSSSSNQSSSQIDPRLFDSLQSTIDRLSGMIPAYEASQQRLAGLPGEIDAMTEDILRRYRLGSEDFIDNSNMAANANAARGIQGGTTSDSMRVGLRDAMRKDLVGNRQNVMNIGQQLKSAAIMGGPQAAAIPMQLMSGLYGTGGQSFGSGSSQGMQENTTAVAQMITDLKLAGYL